MIKNFSFKKGRVLELLSHKQPASVSSGVTLWNRLMGPFDGATITLGLLSCYLPVMLVRLICGNLEMRIKMFKLNRMCLKMVFEQTRTFCTVTCNLIAFLVGDPTEHWNRFLKPLIRRSRGRLTRFSVCWLAISSLNMTHLYGQLFSIDLLTNLLYQPLVALDTFQDLVDYSRSTGVNFTLLYMCGEIEDWTYLYPNITLTGQGFYEAVS